MPVSVEPHKPSRVSILLERFAQHATSWTGSSWAFVLALLSLVVWAILGPYFGYSDTWQLVINTATTIVTFLMVFLIQRSQNKESLVIQVKLNEIIAALTGASNRLINLENLTEDEIRELHDRYQELAERAQRGRSFTQSLTIEDAKPSGKAKAPPQPAEVPSGPCS